MKITKLGLDLLWRVNSLSKHKHKNLCLDPQHPCKKPGMQHMPVIPEQDKVGKDRGS